MKKILYVMVSGIAFILLSWVISTSPITGRWRFHDPKGSPDVILNFKADSTYGVYTEENKLLIEGHYKVSNDTFSVDDNNCGLAKWGIYKLTFFGDDSINIKVINDSCSSRAGDINGLTAKKLSK